MKKNLHIIYNTKYPQLRLQRSHNGAEDSIANTLSAKATAIRFTAITMNKAENPTAGRANSSTVPNQEHASMA